MRLRSATISSTGMGDAERADVRPQPRSESRTYKRPAASRKWKVKPAGQGRAVLAALLTQGRQAQIAAAQEALKLRDQAQAAADAQLLGAAASTATEGGIAMTERHYGEAANLFILAAEMSQLPTEAKRVIIDAGLTRNDVRACRSAL
jgi:hypothetical protein